MRQVISNQPIRFTRTVKELLAATAVGGISLWSIINSQIEVRSLSVTSIGIGVMLGFIVWYIDFSPYMHKIFESYKNIVLFVCIIFIAAAGKQYFSELSFVSGMVGFSVGLLAAIALEKLLL